MPDYILYDLPSKDPCKAWSLNPWKTRLLFNYKTISYETQWVEYPDIQPTFEKHVEANKEGAAYTIPTVRFPDQSYMQDSRKIVERIERDHPDPPLHLNSQYLKKVEELMPQLMTAIAPDFIPKVPKRILNEASLPYWYKTREARLGAPLDQVEKEKGGDLAWENAAPILKQISDMLAEQTNGPFFEGDRVTYVDFVWAGFLRFMQRIGDDVYQQALKASGNPMVHQAFIASCDPWLTRDDH